MSTREQAPLYLASKPSKIRDNDNHEHRRPCLSVKVDVSQLRTAETKVVLRSALKNKAQNWQRTARTRQGRSLAATRRTRYTKKVPPSRLNAHETQAQTNKHARMRLLITKQSRPLAAPSPKTGTSSCRDSRFTPLHSPLSLIHHFLRLFLDETHKEPPACPPSTPTVGSIPLTGG